ncbi:hypothetical protein [Streptomyces sp. NRRL S-350]|uniref:hypothetical protein n=1 Tax=Streptomyces sp. NRRL S-350 TaxID=1463902 RepID=UPI0004BEDB09|nr:hypothetical protein [Streptomyces sp. NRRL S-350]
MRHPSRTVVVAAAALSMLIGTSTTAEAASTRTMTRGVDGCFAYSYEPGFATTTVYFHNRCDEPRYIKIAWKWVGLKASRIRVDGDGKGNEQRRSEPDSVWDDGAA